MFNNFLFEISVLHDIIWKIRVL